MCPPPYSRKPPSKDPVDDADEPTQIGTVDRTLLRAQTRRDRAYLIVLAGENMGQMFPAFRLEPSYVAMGIAIAAVLGAAAAALPAWEASKMRVVDAVRRVA